MKRILLLLLGMTVLAVISGCQRTTEPSGENVFVYTFEKSPDATVETSKAMIGKLLGESDMTNVYKSDDNTVYFTSQKDVNTTFEHNLNTGDISFHKNMTRYLGDFVPKLPSREEAQRASESFLKENNLQPRSMSEMKLAHVGGLRASNVIGGKKAGPVIDKMVTLTYSRMIDSTPVIGPGSKMVVNIGEQGEITGLVRHWRELNGNSKRQLKSEEIYSQQEAEEMAKRQIASEYGEKATYKIIGSGKAYFDNNGSILQPVFVFETTVTLEDRQVTPFNYLCVIQRMKNSPEPLMLTAVDPKAKEMIKTLKEGEKPQEQGDKRATD